MTKSREKSAFVVAVSALDNDRVYAGLVRGNVFVGRKHDVTQSFQAALITWGMGGSEKGCVRVVQAGDEQWEITVKKLKPKRARKG